ncbi:MAG: helix-turn-helix transcriptional regulator [Nitrospiraceae bacterium]
MKQRRRERGWSQEEAAVRLGLSQSYVSMLERGNRPLSPRLARKVARVYGLPTALPVSEPKPTDNQTLAEALARLEYPGFAYLRTRRQRKNPAEVLLVALATNDLEARVTEALPWLLLQYADRLDTRWLLEQARLHTLQNRLGFVVSLARQVAEAAPQYRDRVPALARLEQNLQKSRLANEDTLCQAHLSAARRRWLQENRTPEAAYWNLLTDWRPEALRYVL